MSENKVMNAVLALIEDRPEDARELLRSPEMRVSSTVLQTRVLSSLSNRSNANTVEILKKILTYTLKINIKEQVAKINSEWDASHEEAFIQGINLVEGLLDGYISLLKP